MTLEEHLTTQLKAVWQQGLYRRLKQLESPADAVVMMNGKRVIQFSSNNYLGLADHPALKKVFQEAVEAYGVGSGASRLIAGNVDYYRKLEDRVARFKGTEAALVFPTGLILFIVMP
jgi:7-keto-8-aminopelargonate synthetase-like enzyme